MQQTNNTPLRDPTDEEFPYLLSVKYSNEAIVKRAEEIAQRIEKQLYPIDDMVCIMKGGYHWANLLERFLSPDVRIDADISLYDKQIGVPISDGILERSNFSGRNVLVVDDLVVTGRTINFVLQTIQKENPKKIVIAVLFDKKVKKKTDLWHHQYVRYSAFQPNLHEFFVGYGMTWPTWPSSLRDLKDVYIAKTIPSDFESKISI